jgi:ankyrin repeat protein
MRGRLRSPVSVSSVAGLALTGWLVVALGGGAGAVGCPSAAVGDVMQDPVVRAALDDAWRASHEGYSDEHEEGGFVFQCHGGPTGYETRIQRWPSGRIDGSGGSRGPEPPDGCRAVAEFHTHPGGVGAHGGDGYANDQASDDDQRAATRYGLPGIIRWGVGADPSGTHDLAYGPPAAEHPQWQCPEPPIGSSSGEPHLRTFDGVHYDFQVPGDFVLVEAGDDLTVQVRLEIVGASRISGSHPLAQARSVAVRLGGMTVEIGVDGLFVDGRPVTIGDLADLKPPGGGRVEVDEVGAVRFTWADGSRLVATGPTSLTMRLADARVGTVRGLLGDDDGDPTNDLRAADGTDALAGGLLRFDLVAGAFAEGNRVPAESSLFHDSPQPAIDATGDPGQAVYLADEVRAAAARTCAEAGVTDPQLLADCALDVGASGDERFAADARATQLAAAGLGENVAVPSIAPPVGDLQLLAAASNGDTALVLQLLAAGDLNPDVRRAADDVTPLMIAAQLGDAAMVDAVLAAGADPASRDTAGDTALIFAASHGSPDVIRLLLAAEADSAASTTTGWTPLHAAAFNGNDAAVELLLAAGANVGAVDDRGMAPLVAAAQIGHTSTAALLLDARAAVDQATTIGWTALQWACVNGHVDTVKMLLDHGAAIDHRAADGTTALHAAASAGNLDVVNVLLAAGADRTVVDASGARPLDLALRAGHDAVVAALR